MVGRTGQVTRGKGGSKSQHHQTVSEWGAVPSLLGQHFTCQECTLEGECVSVSVCARTADGRSTQPLFLTDVPAERSAVPSCASPAPSGHAQWGRGST